MAGNRFCKRCGRCCRAISLDFDRAALEALSERESRCLADPHCRHRDGILRLVRDVHFLLEHFHEIPREEAVATNPNFASDEFDNRCFYVCDRLSESGLCLAHDVRPYVCEGYPWYLGSPSRNALVWVPCGYEKELDEPRR